MTKASRPPQGYASGQVMRLARVSRRMLAHWDDSGIVKPSLRSARNRYYTFADIVALRCVAELRRAGITLQALRKVGAFLRERNPAQSFADAWLASDGIDVYELRDDLTISTLRQPGQHVIGMMVLDLGSIAHEIEKEIKIMAA